MRILFLCHFFPPTHAFGAENYTFNLAKALLHKGHDVQVLCVGTWDRGEHYWNGFTDELVEGIQVRRLHLCWYLSPDPNGYLYNNPVTANHLRDWLVQVQPDVVHITSCYTLSASVIQVCKNVGLPVVITLVDFWFICPSLHLLHSDGDLCTGNTTPWQCLRCLMYGAKAYRWPARLFPDSVLDPVLSAISRTSTINRQRGLRGIALNMVERKSFLSRQLQQVDAILAPSKFIAVIHSTIINDLPIRIQTHGHDLSWLSASETPEKTRDTLRFCYIGQIDPIKGVHILIDAFIKLNLANGIELNIWGGLTESPYVAYIQEIVSGLNHIHLRGRFLRLNLAAVLAEADILVMPSLWYENSPLVIQEAFAANVPVIASNSGGMAEFIQHDVNGLLFERGDADDLARQLLRIINEPGLLGRLQSGIPPVKDVEQELYELLAIYEQVAATCP